MTESPRGKDFLRTIVEEDLKSGKYDGVITRFPPEPNGFPHIGHAKSICINFGIAKDYNGICHLRMDDTNPTTEDMVYVEALKDSIKWLGFDWEDKLFFASDYFDKLYEYAQRLIKLGKAYVCSLSEEKIREYRGTVKEAGKASPYRNRSIEESLELFEKMKNGEFPEGAHVLRAKIDMASANMKMRDPLLYRIRHAHHYRTGDKWHIYPMYDFAHCLSDYIEGITHSICTLEFENNRELYDWILDEMELPKPRPYQYEFARLGINYTVMSKRRLLELVKDNYVSGWDDPRMPTLAGIKRRGYTPESIRAFCESVGIAKANSMVDFAQLEFCIRDDLNKKVPRVMCVINPLKVVIENMDADEMIDAPYYPHDVPKEGSRKVPFSKVIYIERDDFKENPPKGYYRLTPNQAVRLRHAYIIKCNEVIKDKNGEVVELRCSYYPNSKSGEDNSGVKVKSAIQWVSAEHAKQVEVRKYDRLYNIENPDGPEDLNPNSLEIIENAYIEPAVVDDAPDERFQFERQGYFYKDPIDSTDSKIVFNRIVPLKDSWGKSVNKEVPVQKKAQPKKEKVQKKSEEISLVLTEEQQVKLGKYKSDFDLNAEVATILAKDEILSAYFEEALSLYNSPVSVANWVANELARELKDKQSVDLGFGVDSFVELVQLVDEEVISAKTAKDVFKKMLLENVSPKAFVEQNELAQISDESQLNTYINEILEQNPKNVELYKEGKTNLFGFFLGQTMAATKGKANPRVLKDLLINRLS